MMVRQTGERKIYSPQVTKRYDNQNKLMWQAAREEIPIWLSAHANTNYILCITQRSQTIKPNQSNVLELI